MVDIQVARRADGVICHLSMAGHARFLEPEEGGDIVCAGLSALAGMLGITFTELLPGAATVSGADGAFSLAVDEGWAERPEVRVVLEGWCRAVKQLEENYKGWVKVEESLVP